MEPGLQKHRTEISRDIPLEVLFEEILVRLPVKSLALYKSVCKTWLHTIESSSFREVHRCRRSCDYIDQIMFSKLWNNSDPITRVTPLSPPTRSSGSGLIKMIPRPLDVVLPPEMLPGIELEGGCIPIGRRASICVLGPIRTTGIYCTIVRLDGLPFRSFPILKISICNKLADPFPPEDMARIPDLPAGNYWRLNHGFGLAADGDYKVVLVLTWGRPFSAFLSYVYSMKQGVWKKIVDSENAMVSRLDFGGKPYYPGITNYCCELCPQVFLHGCWHWMAHFSDNTYSVLSFDVDNEVFKLVLGPPSFRGKRQTEHRILQKTTSNIVSTLNNHLILVVGTFLHSPARSNAISVWMMMEYGDEESWINVWRVNLNCSLMTQLVGISYSLRKDGNGSIHIHRIIFQDRFKTLVSCDEFGEVEQERGFNTSSCIFWNLSL